MSTNLRDTKTGPLNLREELVLLLLNDESGYFYQVPGWNLNCAVVGAALAELSLLFRIDTDTESLYVADKSKTGDIVLDSILEEIAAEPTKRNAQFWIERLAPRAESIIDLTLEHLVKRGILIYQTGEFWSLSHTGWQKAMSEASDGETVELTKTRIANIIFMNEVPDPRDVIIICLVNTCDVLQFIYPIEDEEEERIDLICSMDIIGRSIAAAIDQYLAGPALRRQVGTKRIPFAPASELVINRHALRGNVPAAFARLTNKHGPVFQMRMPFSKKSMIFLAGARTNAWVHRSGRVYLRSKDYLEDFEKVYGASRILPAMDGADHFRMRKAMHSAYSREALEGRVDELYHHARAYMADWKVGQTLPAVTMCRQLMNAQFSQLSVGLDTQDCIGDLLEYKERSLITHIQGALPKFMLSTPGMKRRRKQIFALLERIQAAHTPAQRIGCPRNIIDDFLSLHASDPQFLPETDLHFALVSPLIVSLYLGNALSFAVYSMVNQPSLYERIQAEADALFDGDDPSGKSFSGSEIDVTQRFFLESQRLYPIIPLQIRTVMNTCVVEGHELPMGTRIYIAQTAAHYMDEAFSDPLAFDIDRYLPPRDEHRGPGYAPYGLGTHMCLGHRWVELQVIVNMLLIAYYFKLEMSPANYKLRINPFPTMAPSRKLKFVVTEQRHDIPV